MRLEIGWYYLVRGKLGVYIVMIESKNQTFEDKHTTWGCLVYNKHSDVEHRIRFQRNQFIEILGDDIREVEKNHAEYFI